MSIAVPRQRADGSTPTAAHQEPARPSRPPRRALRWWSELLLIAVLYGAYSAGRLLARGDVRAAYEHGEAILRVQKALWLSPELALNRVLTEHTWLGVICDFAYAAPHYLVTPVVLVWLWRRHPLRYRAARTWLACSTVLGLVGFTLLPTAPPRLLDGSFGFVDTMAQYSSFGWWGSEASAPRGLGGLTNQFAAMPSLHVGWALWCGLLLWRHARSPVVRGAGVLYPVAITLVVMGTANHYLMDAVAGVAVMGVGALLAPYALLAGDRALALGQAFTGRARKRAEPPGAPAAPAARVALTAALPRQQSRSGAGRSGDLDGLR